MHQDFFFFIVSVFLSQLVLFALVGLSELHKIAIRVLFCLFHLLNQLPYSSFLLILLFLLCHHPWVTIPVLPPYFIHSFYGTKLQQRRNRLLREVLDVCQCSSEIIWIMSLIICFNFCLDLKWSGSWTRWSLKVPSDSPRLASPHLSSPPLSPTPLFPTFQSFSRTNEFRWLWKRKYLYTLVNLWGTPNFPKTIQEKNNTFEQRWITITNDWGALTVFNH